MDLADLQAYGSDVIDEIGSGILLMVGNDFPAGGWVTGQPYPEPVLIRAFAEAERQDDPTRAVEAFVRVLIDG